MKKVLLLVVILLCHANVYSKPNIVVSITPVASLVSMLTQDKANIIALDTSSGCPHHHHAKPSDKTTIDESQMVIYIDDNFDNLVPSMLHNYKGTRIKISDFSSINFQATDGSINWHFWLDLENVKALHNSIAKVLAQNFPEIKDEIETNLRRSSIKIDGLIQLKKASLAKLDLIVILSDSLEPFFRSLDIKKLNYFQASNSSLKNIQELYKTLSSPIAKCIILSADQDETLYSRYNKPVIQLNSENWELPNRKNIIPELFINEYIKMINQLKPCT